MAIFEDIKSKQEAFIIAEIGVNYYDIAREQQVTVLEAAKLMVKAAADHGAHAVKFQSYKAETLASIHSPAYWDQKEEPTTSQYELFKKYDAFGVQEYEELAKYCRELKILFMSTPFDFESADYLEPFMEIYKISSSDITNLPFIEYIARKGKPVFLSTGAATLAEIEEAINTIRETGNHAICLLHCILAYPTQYEDANLQMIKHLKAVFPDFIIGYSDHTRPDAAMLVLTTAYQYGAQIIEKHFTLDKSLPGNDHYHAMSPADLKKFCNNLTLLQKIDGNYYKRPLECEQSARKQARRSIVAKKNISAGHIIMDEDITFKRPGTGISPQYSQLIVGRKAKVDIAQDKLFQWEYIN